MASDSGESFEQMVQDLLNQAVNDLNNPNNPYYLPKYLQNSTPCYDPYTQPATWPFNMTNANAMSMAQDICVDIQTANSSVCSSASADYMVDPSVAPVLTLGGPNPGDLTVNGFSNAVIPQGGLVASGNGLPLTITATINFSTLTPATSPTIVGNFVLTQNCCCSTDSTDTKCTPDTSTQYQGTGTFSTMVNGISSAVLVCQITAVSCNHLDMTVTNLTLTAPKAADGSPALKTSVTIKTFPPGVTQTAYDNLANEAFNDAGTRTLIMQQINTVMNSSSSLAVVTTALSTVINNYVHTNNLYPYGCAALELY